MQFIFTHVYIKMSRCANALIKIERAHIKMNFYLTRTKLVF